MGITNIIRAPDSLRMNLVVGRPSLLLGPFLWVLEVVPIISHKPFLESGAL